MPTVRRTSDARMHAAHRRRTDDRPRVQRPRRVAHAGIRSSGSRRLRGRRALRPPRGRRQGPFRLTRPWSGHARKRPVNWRSPERSAAGDPRRSDRRESCRSTCRRARADTGGCVSSRRDWCDRPPRPAADAAPGPRPRRVDVLRPEAPNTHQVVDRDCEGESIADADALLFKKGTPVPRETASLPAGLPTSP